MPRTRHGTRSLTEQLAEVRLARPLSGWVRERRDQGVAWREIARELERFNVSVSHETLRVWYPDPEAEPITLPVAASCP
jgi:hypothetical protein